MSPEIVDFIVTIVKEAGSMGLLAVVLFYVGKYGKELPALLSSVVAALNSIDNSMKQLIAVSQESRVKIERIEDTTDDIKDDVRDLKNKAS